MSPDQTTPQPPFTWEPVDPDLLAYARQTFDVADFMKDVREIEETGEHSFEEVIARIEAAARGKRASGPEGPDAIQKPRQV